MIIITYQKENAAKEQDKSSTLSRLEKEWVALQKVEHARQLLELEKRVQDGPNRERENVKERKLKEVCSVFNCFMSRKAEDIFTALTFSLVWYSYQLSDPEDELC